MPGFDSNGQYFWDNPIQPTAEVACGHKYIGLEKAVDLMLNNYGGSWQTLLDRLEKKGYRLMEVKNG